MKILINDKMQSSDDAPAEIKSPALSDYYNEDTEFTFSFDSAEVINCIGIGYTDATLVTITGQSVPVNVTVPATNQNGLYVLGTELEDDEFTISHNGSYIGRVGVGEYRKLCGNPSMEKGWYTTSENRETLSGQSIPGAGGYSGRVLGFDVRYEIDETIYDDIDDAYALQISKGFPFFMYLVDEQHKITSRMLRFYAKTDKPLSMLQSSTYQFKYSYKFKFMEKF
jgi:hypothetical protein